MRRAEIKLDQVYAELTGDRRNLNPLVPVIASPEVALFHEHSAKPIVRRQIGAAKERPPWPHSGAWLRNIGLRFPGEGFVAFEAWAAGKGGRPEILDTALTTAARLREWFETIPDGTEQVLPKDVVPAGLWLGTFMSRELIGDWLTRRGDQIAQAEQQRRKAEEAKAERLRLQEEFGGVADRAGALLDLGFALKPGKDFHGRTDYTAAQVPLAVLTKLLDEVEDARDRTE